MVCPLAMAHGQGVMCLWCVPRAMAHGQCGLIQMYDEWGSREARRAGDMGFCQNPKVCVELWAATDWSPERVLAVEGRKDGGEG